MRVFFHLICTGMITFAIGSSSAGAVESPRQSETTGESFSTADADRDLKISLDEFTSYYQGGDASKVFRILNRDGDRYLGRDEFTAMQDFSLWDLDLDRKITLQEFTGYYRGDDGAQIFEDLDKNDDGFLDEHEFKAIQSME